MQHYFNQATLPKPYKRTGCGIACAIMALSRSSRKAEAEDVIQKVLHRKAYVEGIGCRHDQLARVLVDYGIPAYNQEFTPPTDDDVRMREYGAQKIVHWVQGGEKNTVIASVNRLPGDWTRRSTIDRSKLQEIIKGGHLVLIHGLTSPPVNGRHERCYSSTSFVIDDPDYEIGRMDEGRAEISYDKFVKSLWRGLAIFVGP